MSLPIVWHPDYSIPQPPGHPFPMGKFAALEPWVRQPGVALHLAESAPHAALAMVHDVVYLEALFTGTLDDRAQRRTGFACTPALAARAALETGGTWQSVQLAVARGLACNAAGGTHHAHHDFGAGYCVLNDLAVAVTQALAEGLAQRVLVLDCDVHQGDGTARLLANEPRAFTVSLHAEKNFPARKAASDLDIALPSGLDDAGYLAELHALLPWLLDSVQPDLVLYDAGVDVHRDDRLGLLALTDEGLFARDHAVLHSCRARGMATAAVIGGGYDHDLARLAARHAQLFRAALAVQGA